MAGTEVQTAELGKYIAKCQHRKTSRRPGSIFTSENPPLLRKGQTNRVLFYVGCFNPPHLGHYNILRRAFEESRDINVIAAIILPLDDDFVRAKCDRQGQSLVLRKSKRARLWQSDPRFRPEWWAYSRSTSAFNSLMERLEDAIERDGFEIRFTAVFGPDHVSRRESYDGRTWYCHETITSDAGRRSNLVKPDGPDRATVKVCHHLWEKDVWVRFVPADADPLDVSSTKIRHLVEGATMSSDRELCEKLKGLVLSPEILADMISDRRFDLFALS
ncbi:hypothetical protein LX36DRAFT_683112 [Colletotrichum falcatum]|nr:hypothetical protein LX36DRAFT_683112 [Colletotrichum falcatum]